MKPQIFCSQNWEHEVSEASVIYRSCIVFLKQWGGGLLITESTKFPNEFRNRTSVPARCNEVKGTATVYQVRHVFLHSLNAYFHCNALKAGTGKATCFAGFVCEKLHHLHMGCKWGTGESGQMCKGRCLNNPGTKTPLIFYHLTTLEIYSYLHTNMSSTINLTLFCEHKISSTGLSYAYK